MTSQTSPTRARGPSDSMSSPTTRTTRPVSGVRSASLTACRYGSKVKPALAADERMFLLQRLGRRIAGALTKQRPRQLPELRIETGVHQPELRLHQAAA